MTTDLQKELAEVVRLGTAADNNDDRLGAANAYEAASNSAANFIRTHHTTIQQNAEAALRLRALERAISEFGSITGQLDDVASIGKRADEILREKENAK